MNNLPFDILKIILQDVISETKDGKIFFNIVKLNQLKGLNKIIKNICENIISNSICYNVKLRDEYINIHTYKFGNAHIALTSLYHLRNIKSLFPNLVSLDLSNCKLKKIPIIPKCVKYLNLSHNEIETFLGCSNHITTLCVSHNQITSFEYCPQNIQHTFDVSYNQIKSFEYCPQNIQHIFDVSCNQITSFEYCPQNIQHTFNVGYNQISSLLHCPQNIQHTFCVWHNQITSFEHCPQNIQHTFYVGFNQITSFLHCPRIITLKDRKEIANSNPINETEKTLLFKN